MSTKSIKVTFKTLTPLWTGDAWGNNTSIRPSSLMGSLRFWFEVICYFAGITGNSNYKDGKLNDDINDKIFKDNISKNGNDFCGTDKTLADMKISLPSRIFGCTGWKGWVRIKKINFDPKKFNNDPRDRVINGKNWFWGSPSYQGNFEVIFDIRSEIVEPVFYPLLTFMEKYGFWGGKWNIGYGRLKVEKVEERSSAGWEEKSDWKSHDEVKFSNFYKEKSIKFDDKKFDNFIKSANNFQGLENISQNVLMYKLENQITQSDFKEIIKELIKIKAQKRCDISDRNGRHNIFGEGGRNAQGTKIIPWIYEEGGELKGGFISIAGIINLG